MAGQTNFYGMSIASLGEFNSLITNNSGGQTTFYDSSSLGPPSINNDDGGSVEFLQQQSSAEDAATINNRVRLTHTVFKTRPPLETPQS